MFRQFRLFALAAMPIVLWPAATHAGADKPRRIVSLYLCADELILQLADRDNIASVTFLARDPASSNVADLAAKVPVNYGHAEEIIARNPDLVIAGAYTTRPAVALLKRAGIPVVELGVAQSLDATRGEIRTVAKAVGEIERGERMIAAMDERFAAWSPPSRPARLHAMVLNPNGFAVGAGSLVDEIFARAGLENVAARLGVDRYGQLPLETIVTSGIDVLILNAERDGPPSLATATLRHPALQKLAGRIRPVVLPSRLWTCGGLGIIEAIERLRAITDDAGRAPLDDSGTRQP
jgi:iron complex transport system substrate-binding protein